MNISDDLKDNIMEHIKALKIDGVDWLNGEVKKVEEKEMIFYGDSFLMLTMEDGRKIDFTYVQSAETSFCFCNEENEKYNKIHNCCGIDCDYEVPAIRKTEVDESTQLHIFSGKQRDLW